MYSTAILLAYFNMIYRARCAVLPEESVDTAETRDLLFVPCARVGLCTCWFVHMTQTALVFRVFFVTLYWPQGHQNAVTEPGSVL
jgi:hypothetical protein